MTAPKTLGPAVDAFLKTPRSPETARTYRKALDPLVTRFGADTQLADLDPADINDWYAEQWGPETGAAGATWSARRAALRSAVAYWHERRWIDADADPAANLKPRRATPVMPIEPLTGDEVLALLAACPLNGAAGIRDRALISLMFRTGVRIGEALALKCADVNLARRTVNIRAGKGGKQRTAGLDDGTMISLQRWLDKRKEMRIRANGNPLFCAITGGAGGGQWVREPGDPLGYDAARKMLKRRAETAGVDYKRIHMHVLRHSGAAELQAEGRSGHEISAWLGHERQSTTDAYLKHIAPPDLVEMARNREPFSDTGAPVERDELDDLRSQMDRLQAELDRLRSKGPLTPALAEANRARTLVASRDSARAAAWALGVLGDEVPLDLAEAGRLRIAHPDASLHELGQLADPPATKDAVAGRLRRLVGAAESQVRAEAE